MDKPYSINVLCGRKALTSPQYNYWHNRDTGYFVRWGKSMMEEPDFCPFGCEVAHVEVTDGTTIMPLEVFKRIFAKLPDTLAIMRFYGCDKHPDKQVMFQHCTDNGVVPEDGGEQPNDAEDGGRFSVYCDVHGKFFPSSVCAGKTGWEKGITLHDKQTFDKVWENKRVIGWRMNILKNTKKTATVKW